MKLSIIICILGLLFIPFSSALAVCLSDDAGAEVCLDAPPKRIISLYGAYTEILWETGAGKLIVAKTKSDDTIAALADLPSVGSSLRPNVEHVLALRPDLVIAKSSKGASEALNALKARGVKVAAFGPESLEELYSVIKKLGQLTGTDARAQQLVVDLDKNLVRIRKLTEGVNSRPMVAFEVRSDPLTVAGSHSLVNGIIEIAGGKNAFLNPKKIFKIDIEAVLQADPDVYVIQTGPMNVSPLPPGERPHHPTLRAVKEGRVLIVDEKLFSRPGPRVAEAAEVLGRFLHPGVWEKPSSTGEINTSIIEGK